MGLHRRTRLSWRDWNPGLDNDHLTLGFVLESLPAIAASEVHWLIRLFENPASPLALPGAITLDRHDALHALLGRGLLLQDEAFVIGFTMGADRRVGERHRRAFHFVGTRLYRPPYRFVREQMRVFDLGFNLGLDNRHRNLQDFPFEDHRPLTLKALRDRLGVSVHRLHALYNVERTLLPDTAASRRLDLDWKKVDPSDIYPPP